MRLRSCRVVKVIGEGRGGEGEEGGWREGSEGRRWREVGSGGGEGMGWRGGRWRREVEGGEGR